jgi:hypothetical protein
MTDWIKHDGGPQPVANDVWVMLDKVGFEAGLAQAWQPAWLNWNKRNTYRVLNQHLIDAARLEGIRLGLEAAAKVIDAGASDWLDERESFALEVEADAIRALDPETIAREAVLDQLTSEAQEQNMGYDKETER